MDPETTTTVNPTEESSTSTQTENHESMEAVTEAFAKTLEAQSSGAEEASEGAGQNKTKTEEEESTEVEKEAEASDKTAETESTEEQKEESSEEKEQETEQEREKFIPRERFDEVNTKLKNAEPLANAQYQLVDWCRKNNIGDQEFGEALNTWALAKSNPQEFVKRLQQKIEEVGVVTGSKLPKDLADEVEGGSLSEARAKELAQLRLKANGHEGVLRKTAEETQAAWVQAMSQTMTSWASTKMAVDPDFVPKKDPKAVDGKFEDFLMRFQALTSQKPPQNFADVTLLAEEAYKATEAMIKRFRPAPVKKKVLTTVGSSATGKVQPKTMDDVTELVARKHGIG